MVHRNYNRAPDARFDVDQVVSFLPIVAKSVLLEDADEALEVNRPEGGHSII